MGCGVTGVEYAAEVRRGSPFPRRWGVPQGEPNSVDRLTWVKMRCWDEEFLKARRLDGSTAVALLEGAAPFAVTMGVNVGGVAATHSGVLPAKAVSDFRRLRPRPGPVT